MTKIQMEELLADVITAIQNGELVSTMVTMYGITRHYEFEPAVFIGQGIDGEDVEYHEFNPECAECVKYADSFEGFDVQNPYTTNL